MTSSNSEVFCPEVHSIFMYNGSPLCMIDDKGGLSIELSVYNIFHRGFRMPESYLNPLFSKWFQKSFGKVVNKVSGVDLYNIIKDNHNKSRPLIAKIVFLPLLKFLTDSCIKKLKLDGLYDQVYQSANDNTTVNLFKHGNFSYEVTINDEKNPFFFSVIIIDDKCCECARYSQ